MAHERHGSSVTWAASSTSGVMVEGFSLIAKSRFQWHVRTRSSASPTHSPQITSGTTWVKYKHLEHATRGQPQPHHASSLQCASPYTELEGRIQR